MDDQQEHHDCALELAKTVEERDQYLNNWKRAKADYSNFERQVERQREDWSHFATLSCLQALLPVYESLVQATSVEKSDDGVVRIRDQMRAAMKSLGVEAMETMGKMPDPMMHEVIGKVEKEGVEQGSIIQEVQPGFLMYGKVLRVAKVIISE